MPVVLQGYSRASSTRRDPGFWRTGRGDESDLVNMIDYNTLCQLITDQFGLSIPVCSVRDGFDTKRREIYVYSRDKVGSHIPFIPR